MILFFQLWKYKKLKNNPNESQHNLKIRTCCYVDPAPFRTVLWVPPVSFCKHQLAVRPSTPKNKLFVTTKFHRARQPDLINVSDSPSSDCPLKQDGRIFCTCNCWIPSPWCFDLVRTSRHKCSNSNYHNCHTTHNCQKQ